MDLKTFSDLELAKMQGNMYQQLMQVQGNLIIINQEIDKRLKPEVKNEQNIQASNNS